MNRRLNSDEVWSGQGESVAYTSLIQDNWHAEVFRVGGAYQIVINAGRDAALKRTFSVAVGLEPLPTGDLEYFFYIVNMEEGTDAYTSHMSGLETKAFIPALARPAILRAILQATKDLLVQVNPITVSWTSYDRNLPEKGLTKFQQIVKVFEVVGYRVEEGEPYHGRHHWHAELLNPPGFPFDKVEGEK